MLAYFFKMDKRPNSTKQPALSQGHQVNVELKDETSFTNPTLKITNEVVSGQFSPDIYNYIFIPYWQRYYFINDWVYMLGIWECTCIVDVLASFKAQIGNTNAFILRSSYENDGNIIDSLYPAKANTQIQTVNVASSWYAVAPSGGCYVVGIISKTSTNKVGAISYYALSSSEFGSLLAYLFSSAIYSGITEISSDLFKSMFNPFQYITSCIWFPFSVTAFGSDYQNIEVGYWATQIRGTVVSALAEKTFVTATIPPHPQINRGVYLNFAPYTKITLYIPPFGAIPIETGYRTKGNYLYSAVLIDHITGQATIRVSICQDSQHLNEYNIMTERNGVIGVPIQLAQISTDYLSTLNNITGAVGNVLTGNIGSAISGIISAVETQIPKVVTNGTNGSFIECIEQPVLMVEHLLLTDENNTEFGRPLYKNRTISTIPGYIQCGEDDHTFTGTRGENIEINQYLKNGFFYE